MVRAYKGSQAHANAFFQRDAAEMAKARWYPVAQSWAPGSWGAGAFVLALLLCLVLVGILIFIYMLIVKPDGTLTVTYQWRPSIGETPAPVAVAEPIANPMEAMTTLAAMHDQGHITTEEFEAKKAEILSRM